MSEVQSIEKREAIIQFFEQPGGWCSETVIRRYSDGSIKVLGMSIVSGPTPIDQWEEIAQRYEKSTKTAS